MKEYLSHKGVEFVVRDIGTEPDAVEELISKYNSRSTPTVIIGDEVVIGFDQARLDTLLGG